MVQKILDSTKEGEDPRAEVIALIETDGLDIMHESVRPLLELIPKPIFVDFNGVLSSTIAEINPLAAQFMAGLQDMGYSPVIVSTNSMVPAAIRTKLVEAGVNMEGVVILTRPYWQNAVPERTDHVNRKNISYLFRTNVLLIDDNPMAHFETDPIEGFITIPILVESYQDTVLPTDFPKLPKNLPKAITLKQVLECLKEREC